MSIIDPCKDEIQEDSVVSSESSTSEGQQATPVTTVVDLPPPPEEQEFYPMETISSSDQEAVNSADRTISMVNEEFFISSPVPAFRGPIRTAAAIAKDKALLQDQIEIDYFRAGNLNLWYQKIL